MGYGGKGSGGYGNNWSGGKGGSGGGKGKHAGYDSWTPPNYGGGSSYGGKGQGGSNYGGKSYGTGYSGKGYQSGTEKAVENLVWMQEQKEWRELEESNKKWEEERQKTEREAKEKEAEARRAEMDSFKGLLRTQHESFVDSLTKQRGHEADSLTKQRGYEAAPAPPKRKAARAEVIESESEEVEMDYKKILLAKKKPKVQRALPPVNPEEWKDWEANGTDATLIKKRFKATALKALDFKGKSLMEIASALESDKKTGDVAELSAMYLEMKKKAAPKRWARVDIIVGLIADAVTDE